MMCSSSDFIRFLAIFCKNCHKNKDFKLICQLVLTDRAWYLMQRWLLDFGCCVRGEWFFWGAGGGGIVIVLVMGGLSYRGGERLALRMCRLCWHCALAFGWHFPKAFDGHYLFGAVPVCLWLLWNPINL